MASSRANPVRLVLLAGLLALCGCSSGPSQDEFAREFTPAFCRASFECAPDGEVATQYGTEEACVAEVGDFLSGEHGSCDYDADVGARLIDEWDEMTCEAFPSAIESTPTPFSDAFPCSTTY